MSADSDVVGMVLDDTREKMAKAAEHTSVELATIRTGRATPALVDKLRVDYYGASTPLQQIAGISAPEPRLLVISPYDKTSMKAIEKSIQESDLGINPQNDGTVIRLAIPALSEERRRDLAKQAKHKAEDGRIAVRNLRRQARHELEAFEKEGDVGTDEVERAERDLDKLTADHVGRIDEMLHHKEADLLQV
ncbi:MAG: ribosome recycling factor [Acidimicrobiales bacterium]